jgi:glycerol-3-phosphate dehydrogenase subunit B
VTPYDCVVVGAGLAGLTAGLRVAESGRRVLVLAKGVGSTQLSSGTIDVLGYAPGRVDSPAEALPDFVAAHPDHPYARSTIETIAAGLDWLAGRTGYTGGLSENLLLPTALGAPKPTALVPETMRAGDLRGEGPFVFVGLRALKDFYPELLADNLRDAGIAARSVEIAPPVEGEGDPGSLGYARRFDRPAFREAVVRELAPLLEPGETVGFPAVLGLKESGTVWRELQERLERPVFEVPTLPPSVPGMRLYALLRRQLREAGARVVVGDSVVGAEREGERVEALLVQTAARVKPVTGRTFVLATGGFTAGGLVMDSYGAVREAVLDLPVAGVPDPPRFLPDYLADQPLSRAGIAVDVAFRPVDADGRTLLENVHVAGATLGGAVPWREKSGDGISLATGYAAAAAILREERVAA